MFYVWVNCFGVIAPVQAWSFANSLFDTRQARRLFGLIGAGASLGAIAGGLLARFLVGPVGGTVNMMLVLAALILLAAAIVIVATARIPRRGPARRGPPPRHPFRDSMRQIAREPVPAADGRAGLPGRDRDAVDRVSAEPGRRSALRRRRGRADRFFGTFNFALGAISFLLQLLFAGPALRRFGVAVTILVLPLSLGFGSLLILLLPGVWTVLLTNGLDQGLRFSLDKATYELLYLPLPPALRAPIKNTIDIVVSRVADAAGAVLLGVATAGLLRAAAVSAPGCAARRPSTSGSSASGAPSRGGSASSTCARSRQTIQRHRIDTERMPPGALDGRRPRRLARRSARSMSPRCAMRSICSRRSASTRACCRRSGSC